MGCTQDRRRRNRFHWPTPQNASPISSIPHAYSLARSSRTPPLIQRNSRRLSTPLYHCFTWEEMRIRGTEEGVYREIRNVLFSHFLSLSLFLSFLPSSRPCTHPPPVELNNGGSTDIEFRSIHSKLFTFYRIRRKKICSISISLFNSTRFNRIS